MKQPRPYDACDSMTATALVALDDSISRDALVRTLNDWQVEVVEARSIRQRRCQLTSPFVISPGFDVSDDATAVTDAMDGVPTIAIGQFGDTRGDALVQTGRVARLLDRPLSAVELANVIGIALNNPADLQRSEEAEDNGHAASHGAPFAGMRVLAADDSPVNREVLSEVLKRLGVQFQMVEDGAAAVAAAKTGAFDLIFMDGSMPEIDGFAATRQIRDWEAEYHIEEAPIVALTAHVVGEKGDLWRDAGMSDFVTKPFSLAAIEACLRRWLPEAEAGMETPDHDGTVDAAVPDPAVAVLLDLDVLGSIRQVQAPGDNLIGRIAGLYIEHAPAAHGQLAAAAEGADAAEIAELAHALKSLSRNVGAVRVGNMADSIENAARNRDARPSKEALAQLGQALDETLAELKEIAEVAHGEAEAAA